MASLANWAGFRNVLVHSYADVKPSLVVNFLNIELAELRLRFLKIASACGLAPSPPPVP